MPTHRWPEPDPIRPPYDVDPLFVAPVVEPVRRLPPPPRPPIRALAATPVEPVMAARCVCGDEPPTRPWNDDDPCRDGNGNFRPGHGYDATAALAATPAEDGAEHRRTDPVETGYLATPAEDEEGRT